MDDLERPPFHPYELEQIEVEFHRLDKNFWTALRELQIPVSVSIAGFVLSGPGKPAPPKRPEELKFTLGRYADSLFYVEASKYPKPHDNLRRWLENLALRIESRVIEQVDDLESSSTQKNLAYHELTEEEMRRAISAELTRSVDKWCPAESSPGNDGQASPVVIAKGHVSSKRLPGTVTSAAAARKLEAYLETNALGMTEFANLVPTTDRTLRSFRKTGKVRRDIFDGIAKAMRTTKEKLLAE